MKNGKGLKKLKSEDLVPLEEWRKREDIKGRSNLVLLFAMQMLHSKAFIIFAIVFSFVFQSLGSCLFKYIGKKEHNVSCIIQRWETYLLLWIQLHFTTHPKSTQNCSVMVTAIAAICKFTMGRYCKKLHYIYISKL